MGRIRTVKPEAFRHEELQDLEKEFPDLKPMLVFMGLWTCCDKCGRFIWSPKHLHLDVLPFLGFSMEDTLNLLESKGYLRRYEVGEKTYGWVPSWKKHQRITGKEASDPPRYPTPPEFAKGNTGEIPNVSPGNNIGTKKDGSPRAKPGRKPREKKPEDQAAALKLPPDLEPWFEACWCDVYPAKVLRDGVQVDVYIGRSAEARERFARCCKRWKPVAIYLALRGYMKNDPKVKEGYVQEFATFLGPVKPTAASKRTLESYLESVLPFLEAHPSVAALTAPPESEEAFRALVKKDEGVQV